MVGDLPDRLAGEDLRVGVGLLDRVGVVGPGQGDRRVARLLEVRGPPVPAARQEPQAVNEDDRDAARGVRSLDCCASLVVMLQPSRTTALLGSVT